jgi:HAD superfamily hydrolase (TIGR01549 family)
MSIKGVFFDLGGTLLIYGDMSAAWSDWLSEFYVCLKRHGLSTPKETFAERCDRFFSKEEPPKREDDLTIFERRIQALCSELQVGMKVADIKRTATTILNAWGKHFFLDPDCHLVLEALQRHKTLGLISNFDHPPYVRGLVSKLGLKEFFAAVVVSGEVGTKKPDPRIFHLALQITGLQPEEVVYVGDTEEDITGSLSAGLVPILIQRDRTKTVLHSHDFRTDYSSTQTQPNAKNMTGIRTISSLPELIDLLE